MRRLLYLTTLLISLLAIARPVLAAALGPGRYGANNPNISYSRITGIGYHDSGDPFYSFDSATWSVVGGDQVRVYKNVWGGGGSLCMDGSVCQSFGYTDTLVVMNLPDRGAHTFTMTNGIITFIDVAYDGTPPVTTATPSGTLGGGGWYRSAVTVSLSAVDPSASFPSDMTSGVAGMTLDGLPYLAPATYSAEGAHTLTYFSTDNKGNVEPPQSLTLRIDTLPPVTTADIAGSMGDAGWHVSPVTVTLASADASSGVAGATLAGLPYTAPVTFATQGDSTVSFSATDVAGNTEAMQSLSFQIDTVAPVTSATLSGPPGSAGWYLGPVALSLSAADATSGVRGVELDGVTYGEPVTFSVDGITTHTFTATDAAGNVEPLNSIAIRIDSFPPVSSYTLDGTSGTDGWYVSPVTVTLTASDSTSGVGGQSFDGAPYLAPVVVSAEGISTHTFFASDVAGNAEPAQSLELRIDTVPPESTLTSPPDGDVGRGVVIFSGTASDSASGIDAVQLSTDGGLTWAAATVSGGEWEHTLDTTTLPDGSHTILVRAADVAGNVEASTRALSLIVDNTPPDITFTAPDAFCPLCGQRAALDYSVADATSGIAEWVLAVVGGPTLDSGSASESNAIEWDGSALAPGRYTLRLKATDVAGNIVEQTADVTLFLPAPPVAVVEFECPLPGDGGWCQSPVTVHLSGRVVGVSIAELNYLYHDEPRLARGSQFSFVEGNGGEHSLSLTVTDTLGRVSQNIAGSFKIDGAPPAVAFGGGSASALRLAVSDSESGIRHWTVQVFDDGGQSVFWQEGTTEFDGELSWSPAQSGTYFISIFARDGAGIEAGLVSEPFVVTVPAPLAIVRQVWSLFAPESTPVPTGTTLTMPVSATLIPALEATPASPPAIAQAPQSRPAPITTSPEGTRLNSTNTPVTAVAPSVVGALLTLSTTGLLLVWLLAVSLDRRSSAIEALARELSARRMSSVILKATTKT
ncbi:hypothetical protein FJY94_04865 [Candidatus Kaiserbacteria bacterium]|nr:hypothetical protein [Candidatus Kaiserbacteria bacterium]